MSLLLRDWTVQPTKTIEFLIDKDSVGDSPRLTLAKARISEFLSLADRGAFPVGQVCPIAPPLALAELTPSLELVPDLRGEVDRVDFRAFQLLRNLLERSEGDTPGLRQVVVRESSVDRESGASAGMTWRLTSADHHSDVLSYPPLSEHLGFKVINEDAMDLVKNRRCVVSMDQPFSTTTLEELLELITDWSKVLERGAYAPPFGAPGVMVAEVGSLHAYDERSVELVFSLYEASEAGWYSLLNLLSHFSTGIARVAEVSIE